MIDQNVDFSYYLLKLIGLFTNAWLGSEIPLLVLRYCTKTVE